MANVVACGFIDDGAGLVDVVVNPLTGEAIMLSSLLGNTYISEITVLDPIHFEDKKVAQKMMEQFNCKGVILSERHLITLDGEVATYRPYTNTAVEEQKISYSTDMSADDFDDYDM